MKFTKKLMAMLLALTMSVVLLVACGNGGAETTAPAAGEETTTAAEQQEETTTEAEQTDETTTAGAEEDDTNDDVTDDAAQLRFMSGLWDQTRVSVHEYIEAAAAEQFPNVEVEWELTGTSADWLNKLKTYNATGDMPDVFYMASSVTFPIINAGNVVDLLPFAREDGFIEEYYPDEQTAGVTEDDKLYAFDEGLDFYFRPVIFGNEKLFAEAGISELPNPWNWEAFLDVAETFKEMDIIPISMADKDSSSFTYFFYQMLLALENPQVVDGIIAGDTDFSNPAAIQTFDRISDLVQRGYFPIDITTLDYGGAMELFNSDQAAMYIQMSWDIGGFADNDNVRLIPWPQINPEVEADDVTLVWTAPNSGYAVYSGTENVDLAVKFAEMCAVQGATAAAEKNAQPSVLKTGVDVTPNLSEIAQINLDIHDNASVKQYTFGNFWFSSKMFAEFSTLGSQLLTGQYSGEQFAEDIAPTWATNFEDRNG